MIALIYLTANSRSYTNTFSGIKYQVYESEGQKSYHQARSFCLKAGGKLPEPRTEYENNYLNSTTLKAFYLSISDEEVEGAWAYADGSPITWNSWGHDTPWKEPNGGSGENFAIMLKQWIESALSHRWADVKPSFMVDGVVCQLYHGVVTG